MRKLVTLLGSALAIASFGAAPALAQEVISIPVDGVIYGQEGTVHPFAVGDVPAEYVGWACSGQAATDNNGSVHPNNDLIITTNGTTVVIPNVEDEPGVLHSISGSLVLGETIDVSVRLGADGVSSGGFVIQFTCSAPAPATTTTVTVGTIPDATTVPPLTTAPTPTTAPEPSGPTITQPPVTTAPATTAPPPAGPSATLPVTGPSTTYLIASSGFALVGAGVALLALVQLAAARMRFSRARND